MRPRWDGLPKRGQVRRLVEVARKNKTSGGDDDWKQLAVIFKAHLAHGHPARFNAAAKQYLLLKDRALPKILSKSEVEDDLREALACLRSLHRIFDEMPEEVSRILREESSSHFKKSERDLLAGRSPHKPTDSDFADSSAYQLIMAAAPLVPELLPAIERTIRRVAGSSPVGTRAVNAWRVVDAAAGLCQNKPFGISVPRHMGHSGPFYRLLLDLFDFHGLSEDPVNIFRSWSRYIGR